LVNLIHPALVKLIFVAIGLLGLPFSAKLAALPVDEANLPIPILDRPAQPSDNFNPAELSQNTGVAPAALEASAPEKVPSHWSLEWRGWDGLHYTFYGSRPRGGRALTDDEFSPSFPSLFTDRVKVRGKIGGRVDLDAAFYVNGNGMEPTANIVELRRWRFYTTGDAIFLVPFSYSVNVMAIDNYHFVLDDVFLEFRRIPYLGTFRVGSFIPAMSLEASGSSRDATFMEWGTPIQGLAPRISAGWQFRRPMFNDRATWSLGQFAQSLGTDVGDATSDFSRIIARLTWLPIYQASPENSGGAHLLHLGLDLSYLRSGNASIRYRSRPESNPAPFLADTGDVNARDMESVGIESAWVHGPWSVQGEFLGNFIASEADQFFYGFYMYGSYFWTGESRSYDTSRGVFGRLQPKRDFSFANEGWGALESAVRFSYLDLDNKLVNGGTLQTMTVGVNWYLHSNSKIRFNYVFAHASGGPQPGDLNIFQTRFEFDF
jgi:phosphate-selective porin OprO/OprP